MNDYQRGLMKAAEICKQYTLSAVSADAIRAEAEKAAEDTVDCPKFTEIPIEKCPRCGYGQNQQQKSQVNIGEQSRDDAAPDEALIEEIKAEFKRIGVDVSSATASEILEYLKRREHA